MGSLFNGTDPHSGNGLAFLFMGCLVEAQAQESRFRAPAAKKIQVLVGIVDVCYSKVAIAPSQSTALALAPFSPLSPSMGLHEGRQRRHTAN